MSFLLRIQPLTSLTVIPSLLPPFRSGVALVAVPNLPHLPGYYGSHRECDEYEGYDEYHQHEEYEGYDEYDQHEEYE